MDGHIRDDLEEYLRCLDSARDADQAFVSRFREQVAGSDDETRRQVQEIEKQALWMRLLRADEDVAPAPGFYGRVMARIEAQTPVSPWAALLEPIHFRRLALAALALLMLFGITIYTAPSEEVLLADEPGVVIPEAVLASDTPTDFGIDQNRDREVLLVNLATYQE